MSRGDLFSVEELRRRRKNLEEDLRERIASFEQVTGVEVADIQIRRLDGSTLTEHGRSVVVSVDARLQL